MPCYHPILMYRSKFGRNPDTGKWPLTTDPKKAYLDMPVYVPCGHCIGCRLMYARDWAVRCVHEASCHSTNCFITLTFSPDGLNEISPSGSLEKRSVQLFLKRLRKAVDNLYDGKRIRFFHCGEYGSMLGRPHHHLLLFGFDFPDKRFIRFRRGFPVFRSPLLEELWPYGMSEIGVFNFNAASYVARYVVKKVNGDMAYDHYNGKLPEYVTMSRRPGIGANWYERYKKQVFPNNFIVIKNGLKVPPPRFYRKMLERDDPELYKSVFGGEFAMSRRALLRKPDQKELDRREAFKKVSVKRLIRDFEGQTLAERAGIVMVTKIYSVYDEKTQTFGSPFFMFTDGQARRIFGDQILDDTKPSLLHQHPEDFTLYRIGEFVDGTGAVEKEIEPKFIAKGIEFKQQLEEQARK